MNQKGTMITKDRVIKKIWHRFVLLSIVNVGCLSSARDCWSSRTTRGKGPTYPEAGS